MTQKSSHSLPNTLYLSLINIDHDSPIPLYRQIYQGLREAIRNGRLPAHTKLPSSRGLSTIWGVSRNTLRNAFDQLLAEGFVETGVGRGTFVAPQPLTKPPQSIEQPEARKRPLSRIGEILEPLGQAARQTYIPASAFAVGLPDAMTFPHTVWNRIINRCQRRLSQRQNRGAGYRGLWSLREAIASYLVSARGLACTPEQVDIVPGSVLGMHLVALTLLNPGDKAWVEEPGYRSVSGLIRYRGTELVLLPVDQDGLDVAHGIATAPDAKLAYVTPSHQYPLGVTLSRARRHQLLDWAASRGSWILEDDYDSEFRYDGPPITALQGLDQQQRVIYSGTFSKVMLPDLRLGFVVLPQDIIDAYTGVKLPLGVQAPTLIQEAIAEFMLEGHFVRHIREMRKHYQAVRDALAEAVEKHLAGYLTLGDQSCGMHTVGYLPSDVDETAVVQTARTLGLAFEGLSDYHLGQPTRRGLLIGYANVRPAEIEGYIQKFAAQTIE